jgi:anthranilate/para-aminobenzoate synthase component I
MVTEIMSALGNICRPGSIEATDIASVVSDKKAHHLVTGITCRKDRNIGAIDCLLNILPACSDGKVAPLITRLENSQRGVYTGTIGFMSVNGHAEFNSAFRTMILKDTIGHLHAGTEVSVDTDAEEAFTRSGKAAERIFEKICTRPS